MLQVVISSEIYLILKNNLKEINNCNSSFQKHSSNNNLLSDLILSNERKIYKQTIGSYIINYLEIMYNYTIPDSEGEISNRFSFLSL